MKMVSLELSEEESKEQAAPALADSPKGPRYPYGMQLQLDDETIEKLGCDFSVGAEIHITAVAKVTSYNEREQEGGEKECSATLQLCEMGCVGEGKSAGDTMYPDQGKKTTE